MIATVVGAGLMGHWHADAARRAGASISAIVDPDPARAASLAREHPSARVFDRLDKALASLPIQVVHISTPLGTHVDLARTALEAGCHALVEKPLASDAAAAHRLFDLAAQRGRLLCPVHQFLFQRGTQRARDALDGLGTLLHLEMEVCSTGSHADPSAGDDVARDILPHALAFAARFCPRSISEGDWTARRPASGELVVGATVGDVGVSARISMNGRPPVNQLRLVAEHGTVILDLFHGFSIVDRSRSYSRAGKVARPFVHATRMGMSAAGNLAWRAMRREPAYPGLRELVKRFHAAARDGGPSPITPEETMDVMDVWERLR